MRLKIYTFLFVNNSNSSKNRNDSFFKINKMFKYIPFFLKLFPLQQIKYFDLFKKIKGMYIYMVQKSLNKNSKKIRKKFKQYELNKKLVPPKLIT